MAPLGDRCGEIVFKGKEKRISQRPILPHPPQIHSWHAADPSVTRREAPDAPSPEDAHASMMLRYTTIHFTMY
jgi:hypothetical protein